MSDVVHVVDGSLVRIYRRETRGSTTLVWWHRVSKMSDGSDAPGRRDGGQFGMSADPVVEVSPRYEARRDPLSRELRLWSLA